LTAQLARPESTGVLDGLRGVSRVFLTQTPILTNHAFHLADARDLSYIEPRSVHLVVSSPPYGSLKAYPEREGQLGNLSSYEDFVQQMAGVLRECWRVLVPGGRACLVVGDVCLSRRKAGRHHVLPLAADIQVQSRCAGFDVLTPIIWLKVANIAMEASRSSRFLGKPYLPGGVIKNDRETIILLRKPGGYRKPTPEMESTSRIGKDDYFRWFAPIWSDVTGASTREHPAPYPMEIPRRLIRMYSFVGDVVVDPFSGTGTTALAAAAAGRNSISGEIEPDYYRQSMRRFEAWHLAHTAQQRLAIEERPALRYAASR